MGHVAGPTNRRFQAVASGNYEYKRISGMGIRISKEKP